MDYKVLYRKYRPQSFEDFVGQNHIKELLLNSIINDKLSHAYLFTGPRGTGKTSAAKVFAKTVNCEDNKTGIPCEKCISCISYKETPDIIEIDAASNNGVDEIRELRDNVKILPTHSKYKVYIIDEVHMLSSSAWNAFLKTLEEPPHHVIFVLATTEIQKVPITVLSRCQRFDFQKISNDVIEAKIEHVAKEEKIKITSDAIVEIARLSDGSMRDALGILDQLSNLNTKIDINVISNSYGGITTKDIENILEMVNNGQISEYVQLLNTIQSNGVEPTILLNKMLDILLLEAINYKSTGKKTYDSITDFENLIIELNQCQNKVNQYLLIKTILLKYSDSDKTEISEVKKEIQEAIEEKPPKTIKKAPKIEEKIISREIISDESVSKIKPKTEINSDLTNIRVNNAYVGANINLKKEFVELWQAFVEKITKKRNFKHLEFIEDIKIEVVSPTNVILSTEFYSNSILFNSSLKEIEDLLLKETEIDKKLICLDNETWDKEKTEYMKNRKTKEYELIHEHEDIIKNETLNVAEDLFGNDLLEIN